MHGFVYTRVMAEDNKDLKRALEDLGFSDKESSVYLALLELGKGTVSQISRKARINRTTGYDILANLAVKGLINVSGKEPKQEYMAESPERLVPLLKEQFDRSARNIKLAEKYIPKLKSIQRTGDRPQVRFYEGKEGLIQVYEDTLTSSEPIRAYATIDDPHKTLPHYFPEYYKRRSRKNISIRAIVPKTELGIERAKYNSEEKREIAFVPVENYRFSPEINIYDDKVMIASWQEKLGIIIESKEIADAMKKIYELSWAEAKRLDEKSTP